MKSLLVRQCSLFGIGFVERFDHPFTTGGCVMTVLADVQNLCSLWICDSKIGFGSFSLLRAESRSFWNWLLWATWLLGIGNWHPFIFIFSFQKLLSYFIQTNTIDCLSQTRLELLKWNPVNTLFAVFRRKRGYRSEWCTIIAQYFPKICHQK